MRWRWAGLAMLGLLLAYTVAIVIGALIPVNRDWRSAPQGVAVYVADNGIHTDLVMPAEDFADLLHPERLRDPRYGGHRYVMFGWGDRDFYLNTPTWWDVNPWRVAKAMVGAGSTVMHVDHVSEPHNEAGVKRVMLTPDQYGRLLRYVRASFAEGEPVVGYGLSDAFYPAKGGYNAIRTCNQWTADGLRQAGVRTSRWAPYPWGVMRWL